MTQEQKDVLNKYAEIKKQINILEDKADGYKGEVLLILEESGAEEVSIGNDKITLGSRRSWKYTPKVKELKKALDDQKAYEERTGEADYTENKYPIFKDSDHRKEKEY